MSDYIRNLKRTIKEQELKIATAGKSTKAKFVEDFEGFCKQLAAHFKRRGDERNANAYLIKSEVYDDDEKMESIDER